MTAEPPDRVDIAVEVTRALAERFAEAATASPVDLGEDGRTAVGALVCTAGAGTLAGLQVARETFARVGVRLRPLLVDGAAVERGARVADLGGPVRAMRLAEPTAVEFLERLSAVASATRPPEPGAPFDAYAASLVSGAVPVRDNGPRFGVEVP